MEEFLEFMSSPAGVAIFSVVAAAIVIAVIALNYRFFAKSALDFLFGLVFFIITSPLMAVCAAVVRANAGRACTRCWIVGKGGKPVEVRVFSDYMSGEKQGYICRTWLKYLPLLLSVITGKLSLVGPSPLPLIDGTLIPEEYEGRFSVRPGLFSSAANIFPRRPAYEEMFAADCDYAARRNLFSDLRSFFVPLLRLFRGEKSGFISLGRDGYAEELLSRGAITGEQYDKAGELARQSVEDLRRAKNRVG